MENAQIVPIDNYKCKHCNIKCDLVKSKHKGKKHLKKEYNYTHYFRCNGCSRMYMDDRFKIKNTLFNSMANKKSYKKRVDSIVYYNELQTDRTMEYQKFFDHALQSTRPVIFFDGAAQETNAPGKYDATWAYVLMFDDVYIRGGRHVGTNNTGEQTALLEALEHAVELGMDVVDVYGDSAMILKQAAGLWGVKAPHLKDGYIKTIDLINQMDEVTINWVPREQNQIADFFSKRVYDVCDIGEEYTFDQDELYTNLPEEYL